MVLPQRVTAEESFPFVPPVLAVAAAEYQLALAAESAQLARMGQENLNVAWTDEVRSTVLLARARIFEAQAARARLREQVRAFVIASRDTGDSVSSMLRHTRSMIRLLESTDTVDDDGGRLESEVLAWATEEYESH
jgi:hypothetical protein